MEASRGTIRNYVGVRSRPTVVRLADLPMGLMRRNGREYATAPNLDRHELVRLLAPLLEHSPSPVPSTIIWHSRSTASCPTR